MAHLYLWETAVVLCFAALVCAADVRPSTERLNVCLSWEALAYAGMVSAWALLILVPATTLLRLLGLHALIWVIWLSIGCVCIARIIGIKWWPNGPVAATRSAAIAAGLAIKAKRATKLTAKLLRTRTLPELRAIVHADSEMQNDAKAPAGADEKVYLACLVANRRAAIAIKPRARSSLLKVLRWLVFYILLPVALNLIAAKIDRASSSEAPSRISSPHGVNPPEKSAPTVVPIAVRCSVFKKSSEPSCYCWNLRRPIR